MVGDSSLNAERGVRRRHPCILRSGNVITACYSVLPYYSIAGTVISGTVFSSADRSHSPRSLFQPRQSAIHPITIPLLLSFYHYQSINPALHCTSIVQALPLTERRKRTITQPPRQLLLQSQCPNKPKRSASSPRCPSSLILPRMIP